MSIATQEQAQGSIAVAPPPGGYIPWSGGRLQTGDILAPDGAHDTIRYGSDTAYYGSYVGIDGDSQNYLVADEGGQDYAGIQVVAGNDTQIVLEVAGNTGYRSFTVRQDAPLFVQGDFIEYDQDYSNDYTDRALVDKQYAFSYLRDSPLPAPTALNDGQAIAWDEGTASWIYVDADLANYVPLAGTLDLTGNFFVGSHNAVDFGLSNRTSGGGQTRYATTEYTKINGGADGLTAILHAQFDTPSVEAMVGVDVNDNDEAFLYYRSNAAFTKVSTKSNIINISDEVGIYATKSRGALTDISIPNWIDVYSNLRDQPLPAPTALNDGQVIAWDDATSSWVYVDANLSDYIPLAGSNAIVGNLLNNTGSMAVGLSDFSATTQYDTSQVRTAADGPTKEASGRGNITANPFYILAASQTTIANSTRTFNVRSNTSFLATGEAIEYAANYQSGITDRKLPDWGNVKANLRGFPLPAPSSSNDNQTVAWDNGTSAFKYANVLSRTGSAVQFTAAVTLTNNTTETIMAVVTIPGGIMSASDILALQFYLGFSSVANFPTWKMYWSTSPSTFTGANQIATFTMASQVSMQSFARTLLFYSASSQVIASTTTSGADDPTLAYPASSLAIDFTTTKYIVLTVQMPLTGSSAVVYGSSAKSSRYLPLN